MAFSPTNYNLTESVPRTVAYFIYQYPLALWTYWITCSH